MAMESAVNIVLEETNFLQGVNDEVKIFKDKLMLLQGFLQDAESQRRLGNIAAATFLSRIRDVAYEAENVIEYANCIEMRNRVRSLKKGFIAAIARYTHLPVDLIVLYRVGVEIRRVKKKLSEIFQTAEHLHINELVSTSHDVVEETSEHYQNYKDNIVMVGFEDEYKEIVDKLVHEEKMLSAVSIVAMGGAGKTTLTRKVYTSSRVKQYFEAVAWVTVSQKFKVIDLLTEIAKQISSGGDRSRNIDEMSEYEVGKIIHDILLQKRYLIVLDDVWESDTWEQLNTTAKSFPDANNGSRLLLTTRNKNVVNHIQMRRHIHALKLLDEDKSWELFSSKAFPLYARLDIHDLDKFRQLGIKLAKKCGGLPLALAVLGGYLSKNLNTKAWTDVLSGWPETKDTQIIRGMIARSYKDLPNHYLRSCLLYLAAYPEDYVIEVDELIRLWMAESFIPRRRKHTLEETGRKYVSELAQRSLVQFVQNNNDGYKCTKDEIIIHDIIRDWCIEEASQDGFLDVVDEPRGQVGALPCGTLIAYRSSFQNLHGGILEATRNLRTLLGFRLSSVSFPELRFIRVLQIDGLNLKDFSKVIGRCVHLRYLKLTECDDLTLPSSFGELLVYLQTIDMRGTQLESGTPISSLWDIPTLRYAYINNVISLPLSANIPQNLLELHMEGVAAESNEDPMPILEKLPCLVVLGLYNWEAKTMHCSAQGFPCLQKLKLCSFWFEKWTMEAGAMPNLSYLSLYRCEFTGGIPEGLLNLQSISALFLSQMGEVADDVTVTKLIQKGCEVNLGGRILALP